MNVKRQLLILITFIPMLLAQAPEETLTRSVMRNPDLVFISDVCILEGRGNEIVINTYQPEACRCTTLFCQPNFELLDPYKVTILNWGTTTKQVTFFGKDQSPLTRAFNSSRLDRAYPGRPLIDELEHAIPMWWRLRSSENLGQLVEYLKKALPGSEYPHALKPVALLITLDSGSIDDLEKESLQFLEHYFDLIGPHDEHARRFFLRADRAMVREIQRLELHDPLFIEEESAAKLLRMTEEFIKSITLKDTLMAGCFIGTWWIYRNWTQSRP